MFKTKPENESECDYECQSWILMYTILVCQIVEETTTFKVEDLHQGFCFCFLLSLFLRTSRPLFFIQRNSHWRVQGFAGQPHATENGSGLVSLFPGKFEENIVGITLNTLASTQNTVELEAGRDVVKGSVDQSIDASVQSDGAIAYPLQRPSGIDSQSTAGPLMENVLNQPEDLSIEGGTISISSEYSQE